jgi:hypothetical protein
MTSGILFSNARCLKIEILQKLISIGTCINKVIHSIDLFHYVKSGIAAINIFCFIDMSLVLAALLVNFVML